jgi:hypothetical protein
MGFFARTHKAYVHLTSGQRVRVTSPLPADEVRAGVAGWAKHDAYALYGIETQAGVSVHVVHQALEGPFRRVSHSWWSRLSLRVVPSLRGCEVVGDLGPPRWSRAALSVIVVFLALFSPGMALGILFGDLEPEPPALLALAPFAPWPALLLVVRLSSYLNRGAEAALLEHLGLRTGTTSGEETAPPGSC